MSETAMKTHLTHLLLPRVHRFALMASILAFILLLWAPTRLIPSSFAQEATSAPERQIDLRTFSFEPPQAPNHKNSEVFADLSLLFQDVHTRIEFVSGRELVVYFSNPVDERVTARSGQSSHSQPAHNMQALFVNLDNGILISRKVWETRSRRFFNYRYDTQATIMPVRAGFLVHANNSLVLYSPDLQKTQEIQLDPSFEYSAMVAPGGNVSFLEQSTPGAATSSGGVSMVVNGDSDHWPVAHGEWRSSETFEKVRSMDLFPGAAESVSSDAFAGTWFKCVDLQRAGLPNSHLSCTDPYRYGRPMFLSDSELVLNYPGGFQVLSTSGDVLWERQISSDHTAYDLYDCVHSLDESRFAMSVFAYRKIEFENTMIPKRRFAVIVYDRSQRTKVFSVVVNSEQALTIALSPEGDRLAILSGTTLFLYRIPDQFRRVASIFCAL
jgi:hypothetical protein